MPEHVGAEHFETARRGNQQAENHRNGGRFSGAIAAKQADDLSFPGFEAQIFDGHDIAKSLGEILYFDCKLRHCGNMGRTVCKCQCLNCRC